MYIAINSSNISYCYFFCHYIKQLRLRTIIFSKTAHILFNINFQKCHCY